MLTDSAKKKPTLSQIADSLGVSIATVSKVVNGKPDISTETRQKVEGALLKSGYRKTSKTNHPQYIEIVFQKLDSLWEIEILRGLEDAANKNGLSVIVTVNGNKLHPASDWVDGVIRRNPIGVILVFSSLMPNETHKLRSRNIPYTILDPSGDPSPESMSVHADNWTGGLIATRHLISLGHKRIAIITGPTDMMCSKARLDGYQAALEEAGIPIDDSLVKIGNFDETEGLAQGKALLQMENPPTAIFAGSDRQAMGVFEAARQLNVKIPENLSVVGFDDVQTAAYMNPSLTTVRQPLRDMAAQALQMILDAKQGKADAEKSIIFPTSLITRSSTAALEEKN
ncbi:LacI family DNA-binding transcriptional regulator [Bifidobacterium sp. ESL0728]|uniref:LacI family DNA-binding transcriptional regulator n=1 Tax=Bifidobacterium sp. ESL0728 TaxID=2983220 RepID=UPI0023F86AE1|nr:LacI family DNA-binding transcriptional regulator [Bifidobacterium sp. ESL0728]WEV59553.1 LacI family DNA-binding transcriptional regulator [Bifidobacterium sp. ESL0728]